MKEYAQIEDAEKRLDEKTKANLRRVVKERLGKDYDFVLLIVGLVGDGKSCLAALVGAYVSSLTGRPFDTRNIFWTVHDYRRKKKYLKRKSVLDFDEGEEIFFSRTATKIDQREMILKFAQIRAKNHFIIICVPSLLLLEKYLRGVGSETRVSCIWRIKRRGVFLCYAAKTGKLRRIKINREANKVVYPPCDFVGYWRAIPKKSEFWKQYTAEKTQFLDGTEQLEDESEFDISAERIKNSMTQLETAQALGVSKKTIQRWIASGKIPKESAFRDYVGRWRIDRAFFDDRVA